MTPTEYAQKLEKQLQAIVNVNRPFALGVTAAHAMMTLRIFTDGEDVNNSQIGQYSKKPLYTKLLSQPVGKKAKARGTNYGIAARNAGGFNPNKGKNGESKFKNGSPHITSYFEGWAGVRDAQGLKTEKVNLNFVGDLKSDFERPAKKIDVNLYEVDLSRDLNNKKAKGNEDHFGKVIFVPSKAEIEELIRVTELELELLLS